jgi:hypothetical protein
MNKSLLLIPILGILLTSGCQLFEDDLGTNNGVLAVAIPTTTEDFISDNYPDYDIDSADEDDICDDVPVYEVELENGSGPDIDLYFDLDWNFLFEAVDIAVADLPAAVTATIQSEYPNHQIEQDETERWTYPDGTVRFQVELELGSEDIELVLNEDGSIHCVGISNDDDDDDDDDDDGNGSSVNIPADVTSFINDNYGSYDIDGAYEEDICDDVAVYEIELEDGSGPDIDLYFDLDWNFLFEAVDIPVADLPAAVTAAIQSEYPNHQIEQDETERWTYADGTVRYQVELESSSEDDVELVLNGDGSIHCVGTSNDDDDDDDDDDDGNGSSVNIPADVTSFINDNYGSYDIDGAYEEDICDDVPVYEVELEDGAGPDIDLYFDLDWNFLFEAVEIAVADLPAAVTATIQSEYPGYQIEQDETERWTYPDGTIRYQVYLESSSEDIELVLNADGSIHCTDD